MPFDDTATEYLIYPDVSFGGIHRTFEPEERELTAAAMPPREPVPNGIQRQDQHADELLYRLDNPIVQLAECRQEERALGARRLRCSVGVVNHSQWRLGDRDGLYAEGMSSDSGRAEWPRSSELWLPSVFDHCLEDFCRELLAAPPGLVQGSSGARNILFAPAFDRSAPRGMAEFYRAVIRAALQLILERRHLTLTILTSHLDELGSLDLLRGFGDRLMVGIRIPTRSEHLLSICEANTRTPSQRWRDLEKAKRAGLRIFAAVAPLVCRYDPLGLAALFERIVHFEPEAIYCQAHPDPHWHRSICEQARAARIRPHRGSFEHPEHAAQLLETFELIERVAAELGIDHKLRLAADAALTSPLFVESLPDPSAHRARLARWAEEERYWIGDRDRAAARQRSGERVPGNLRGPGATARPLLSF